MERDTEEGAKATLAGKRLLFVGRLAGMPRREARSIARQHGGIPVDTTDGAVDLVVMGEHDLPVPDNDLLAPQLRAAAAAGRTEIVTETRLWERLGFLETDGGVQRLFTPAMLAELLGVPVAVIRRWHRRGLINAARQVHRLPYFDYQEVSSARRLAGLLAAGVSPKAIEIKLEGLRRFLPEVDRSLVQLSIIVEGKDLLLRQGEGLIDAGGQLRFDFHAPHELDSAADHPSETSPSGTLPSEMAASATLPPDRIRREPQRPLTGPLSAAELTRLAAELEDAGELNSASEMYRAALAAGGPNPETCFLLAESLYRTGDINAARERYYMAVELDEEYVEARSNLGCVLAETGQPELALAAFQGALACHPDYPDAHFHLAGLLEEMDRRDEAADHWRAFLHLSPDTPWADEARSRLALLDDSNPVDDDGL